MEIQLFSFSDLICLWFFFGCAGSLLLHKVFSRFGEWGATLVAVLWASYCSGFSCCGAWALGCTGFSSCGSWAQAHRLSCPWACKILQDQGSNPCFLLWQADSPLLNHQGSPWRFSDSRTLGFLTMIILIKLFFCVNTAWFLSCSFYS